MNTFICPWCGEKSYSSAEKEFLKDPYCVKCGTEVEEME